MENIYIQKIMGRVVFYYTLVKLSMSGLIDFS